MLLEAGRNLYLDAVTTKRSTPGAASSIWDQLTSFLRTSASAVLVFGLIVAFAAAIVTVIWGPRTFARYSNA